MNRKKADGGVFQPQTLEVDEAIIDKNLKIVEPSSGDSAMEALFPERKALKKTRALLPEPDLPSVEVTPGPGICIKTKNVAGGKVFINLCKIQEIPPAPPLTEEALRDLIASENYDSDFRVPMSLGAPREEKDKSGNGCLVCDVAVNSVWYEETMLNSIIFTTFVVNVAMEGLCDKYGDSVNLDRQNWTVLRNKTYFGKIQRHNIQQRGKGHMIEEMTEGDPVSQRSKVGTKRTPECTLFKVLGDSVRADYIRGEIFLPDARSKDDIILDIGEDRIVCESERYQLDIFLPFDVVQETCEAEFDARSGKLVIKMPIS